MIHLPSQGCCSAPCGSSRPQTKVLHKLPRSLGRFTRSTAANVTVRASRSVDGEGHQCPPLSPSSSVRPFRRRYHCCLIVLEIITIQIFCKTINASIKESNNFIIYNTCILCCNSVKTFDFASNVVAHKQIYLCLRAVIVLRCSFVTIHSATT